MVYKSCPVRLHLQDQQDWCGQACVQMVAAAMAPALKPDTPLINQQAVGGKYRSAALPGWGSSPNQLQEALAALMPKLPWQVVRFNTEEELLAAIAVSMRKFRTPAIVTHRKWDHWRVVDAIDVNANLPMVAAKDPTALEDHLYGGARCHTHHDGCNLPLPGQLVPAGDVITLEKSWTSFDAMVEGSDQAFGILCWTCALDKHRVYANALATLRVSTYEMTGVETNRESFRHRRKRS